MSPIAVIVTPAMDRQGSTRQNSGARGWTGPFDTRDKAIAYMNSLKVKNSKTWGLCNP
jgi:hypothetical protein